MLTDDGLLLERSYLFGGTQRLYRWGNYGASAVNSSMLHHFPFAWEVAVLRYEGERGWLAYDTPLTNDVEVFASDSATNEFLMKIKAFAEGR